MADDDRMDEQPLDEEDREQLRQDLLDVDLLMEMLGSKGIKGAVFFCPDCGEDHFLTWELMKGNLESMLEQGSSPIHEPAFAPDPDEYVSWDFARGYLDGYESFEDEELTELTVRLVNALSRRGWSSEQVKEFLGEIEIDFPAVDRPGRSEGMG